MMLLSRSAPSHLCVRCLQTHLGKQGFVANLRAHLFARLCADDATHTPQSQDDIIISQDRIYSHATMSLNYTTYDLQRDQDIIHVGTSKTGIMVYSPLQSEWTDLTRPYPWLYASVLGIYHANVTVRSTSGTQSVRKDFLWVRWLETQTSSAFGVSASRLERVSHVALVDDDWPATVGFVDPCTVLRGCHFVPAFRYGRTTTLLPPSIARDAHPDGDWDSYYVNWCVTLITIACSHRLRTYDSYISFVDRDMFVRHLGCGIGHIELGALTVEELIPAEYTFTCALETDTERTADADLDAEDGEGGRMEEDMEDDVAVDYDGQEDQCYEDVIELRDPWTTYVEYYRDSYPETVSHKVGHSVTVSSARHTD